MRSKYDGIKTAKDLIAEVSIHGLSLAQEDLNRAADIIGNEPIENLVFLANHIGRKNDDGEDDPKGSWSGGSPATRSTFYSVLFRIWNWEDATRFWSRYSNPEHEEVEELRRKLKAEMEEHRSTKKALEEQRVSTEAEHKFRLAEQSTKRKTEELNEKLKAELHDRDMEIMALKAKLYDLMTTGKE